MVLLYYEAAYERAAVLPSTMMLPPRAAAAGRLVHMKKLRLLSTWTQSYSRSRCATRARPRYSFLAHAVVYSSFNKNYLKKTL